MTSRGQTGSAVASTIALHPPVSGAKDMRMLSSRVEQGEAIPDAATGKHT
jgi:hypothetical protein